MGRRMAVVFVGLSASFLGAAEKTAFTSNAAKLARTRYGNGIRDLDQQYQAELGKLQKRYFQELHEARKAAVRRKDLDETQRILAAIEELREEMDATALGGGGRLPRFRILNALLGWNDRWVDVTGKIRKAVRDGRLQADGAGALKLGDPAFGHHKSLVIHYAVRGRPRVAVFGQSQRIALP